MAGISKTNRNNLDGWIRRRVCIFDIGENSPFKESRVTLNRISFFYFVCFSTLLCFMVLLVRRRWRWTTVSSCPTCHPRGTTCCYFIPERSSSWTWSSARRWAWWPSSALGCPSFRWGAAYMYSKLSLMRILVRLDGICGNCTLQKS